MRLFVARSETLMIVRTFDVLQTHVIMVNPDFIALTIRGLKEGKLFLSHEA